MADVRYKWVSRARPCLICGKPDWCSRAGDDSISFCARVTAGADRLSQNQGWGVFYHDVEKSPQPNLNRREQQNYQEQAKPEIKAAPLEIRDFVYNLLFKLSPARNFQSLTQGAKGLFERGLKNTDDYGALPCSIAERKKLAAQIRVLLNRNFPSFVRQNLHGISHIPGFWINDYGEVRLWCDKDYYHPMLLIPYRNPFGKIQACQIRFFGADSPKQNRYLWLSLPSLCSVGTGTPLHFANWRMFGKSGLNFSVIVTEGALKADTVVNFFPQHLIIANSGVGCSHQLIARTSFGKKVLIAFDNDYCKNPAVVRQLSNLIFTILEDNTFQFFHDKVSILYWDHKFNGIDDALLNNSAIREVGLNDWISLLSLENREIFLQVFKSKQIKHFG
jgi:hypothetical protein